ncbi:MAG: DUF6508 domain-containing protein [Anaerolineales bacterium]
MSTDPNPQALDSLLAFIPLLCVPSFEPVVTWHSEPGTFPWPEYHTDVDAFAQAIAEQGWLDTDYLDYQPGILLADPAAIASATLAQAKAMLTYFVRGERFADGHRAALIENGQLCALLQRLQELRDQTP